MPGERRPAVTTAKLIGSSFGSTLGIAVVTVSSDLPSAMLIVARLDTLLLLPMLRYR